MNQHENDQLVHQLQLLGSSLTGGNYTAYPMLAPVLHQVACEIQSLGFMLERVHFTESVLGKSPWAKLYKLQTGRAIEIPESFLNAGNKQNGLPGELTHWISQHGWELVGILNYARKHRGFDADLVAWEGDCGTLVEVNLDTAEVRMSWRMNDMEVKLDKYYETTSRVNCPLFETPYRFQLSPAILHNLVVIPLYHKLVGEHDREPIDRKRLLSDHYCGTAENPKELDEGHPYIQLRELLEAHSYGKYHQSYAEVVWKEYSVRFSQIVNWDYNPPRTIALDLYRIDGNGNAEPTWTKNPLLVHDLLADMDGLLDKVLTQHHQELAELAEKELAKTQAQEPSADPDEV